MLEDISNVTREYRPFVQTCSFILQLLKEEEKKIVVLESPRIEVFMKGGIDNKYQQSPAGEISWNVVFPAVPCDSMQKQQHRNELPIWNWHVWQG
jgi:hypothetical protein